MTWKKTNNADAGAADKFGGNDLDKVSDSFNGVNVSDPIIYNTDFNTLKNTTNAAGDLLKSNGSKYVRFPKGTANQVLRVNAAGTDLEYAAEAGGGGAGDVTGAANVGTGTGTVFRDEVTGVLNLKSLLAGANITVTNNANDVTIAASGGSWSPSATETLTNKTIDADTNTVIDIGNSAIKAAAGIVYSKLALSNSIVNADINTSAAIAKTKLANLDIVNADVNASAAIAKSKLASLNIVNADVNASAAIAWTKLDKTGSAINDLDDVTITTPSTNQILSYNGTVWVNSAGGGSALTGLPFKAFDYTIYNDAGTYYSIKNDGTTAFSGTTAETVINNTFSEIQTADTFNKSVFFAAGLYSMSGAFAGLNFNCRYTNLIFSPGCIIRVPQGYAGVTLKCQPTATRYFIQSRIIGFGARFDEGGTAQKLWKGIQFSVPASGTQQGIQNNWVQGLTFVNANKAIELQCLRDVGWNNSNMFKDISIFECLTGINFDMSVTRAPIGQYAYDTTGFNRNTFSDILFQPVMLASPAVADQIDNVKHDNNLFHNMQIADVDMSVNSIHILSDANFTTISGTGLPTYKRFFDESETTIITATGDQGPVGPFSDSSRMTGWIGNGSITSGYGLLEGQTNYVAPTLATNNAHNYRRYQTTTTTNTTVGWRLNSMPFRMNQRPALRAVIQTDETTNNRCFIGWINNTGALAFTGDGVGDNSYCLGFAFRPASANWWIYWNNNSASQSTFDTGIARTGSTSYLQMLVYRNNEILYRIGTSDTNIGMNRYQPHTVTDIGGNDLGFQCILANSAAENKSLRIGKLKIWAGRDA